MGVKLVELKVVVLVVVLAVEKADAMVLQMVDLLGVVMVDL